MTCQHGSDDPNCSAVQQRLKKKARIAKKARKRVFEELRQNPLTPDKHHYRVVDVQEVAGNLVLKVQYPSCATCAYEGTKIMVFRDVTAIQALRWACLDPHFRDPTQKLSEGEAPPPIARFPGNAEGWADALEMAARKGSEHLTGDPYTR